MKYGDKLTSFIGVDGRLWDGEGCYRLTYRDTSSPLPVANIKEVYEDFAVIAVRPSDDDFYEIIAPLNKIRLEVWI